MRYFITLLLVSISVPVLSQDRIKREVLWEIAIRSVELSSKLKFALFQSTDKTNEQLFQNRDHTYYPGTTMLEPDTLFSIASNQISTSNKGNLLLLKDLVTQNKKVDNFQDINTNLDLALNLLSDINFHPDYIYAEKVIQEMLYRISSASSKNPIPYNECTKILNNLNNPKNYTDTVFTYNSFSRLFYYLYRSIDKSEFLFIKKGLIDFSDVKFYNLYYSIGPSVNTNRFSETLVSLKASLQNLSIIIENKISSLNNIDSPPKRPGLAKDVSSIKNQPNTHKNVSKENPKSDSLKVADTSNTANKGQAKPQPPPPENLQQMLIRIFWDTVIGKIVLCVIALIIGIFTVWASLPDSSKESIMAKWFSNKFKKLDKGSFELVEKIIYESANKNDISLGYDFKGKNGRIFDDNNLPITGEGTGEIKIEKGVIKIIRTNTDGRFEVWLLSYFYDEKLFIPKDEIRDDRRSMRISFDAKTSEGEHTLKFVFKGIETQKWMENKSVRVSGQYWTNYNFQVYVSAKDRSQLRIDNQDLTTTSTLFIKNFILAEKT